MNLFDILNLKEELKKLEEKTNNADFWQDSQNSSKILNIFCAFLNPCLNILKIPVIYSSSIITGIIEVTNGVKLAALDSSPVSIIICSFLLGFGGISVLLQVLSITSEAKISIKPYILGKFLQACFSAIFMCLLLF